MSLSLCKMSYKSRSKCPTSTPFLSFASDKPGNWSQSAVLGIVCCRDKTSDGATMKEECNVKCVAVVYWSENSLSLLLCFELLKRRGNSKGKRLASTALVVIHQRHKTQFYDIKAFKTAPLHVSPSTGTHSDHRSFFMLYTILGRMGLPKSGFPSETARCGFPSGTARCGFSSIHTVRSSPYPTFSHFLALPWNLVKR
ncbi:hypothetical protein AVEN_190493-1 [Araneus ventricosus]|uniref:Uncharacterized protein n=1 Tax=Araneus ventricosus TaxID=182803 RepID=A0A4Y2JDX5_ARAVE|nr:hypothetical protein AVEN_190493-1 [Araneus ventricosus]